MVLESQIKFVDAGVQTDDLRMKVTVIDSSPMRKSANISKIEQKSVVD
jgi:hypothetical protein